MRNLLCLLVLPLALYSQTIGDTPQMVEATLGKPQLKRNLDNGQIWIYGNGTKIKFENGQVKELSSRGAASVSEVPATKISPAVRSETVSLHKAILGDCQGSLIRAGGGAADPQPIMQKRYLFLYFSAHWCGPCRAFTPKLVEFYNKNFGIGDFDLVFVSSDRSQQDMDKYLREAKMPWSGIKLGHPTIDALKRKFGVSGIPCLVLLNENDELLASSFNAENYLGPQVAVDKYLALHR